MKALIFDKPGFDNLQLRDVVTPGIGDHEVLVKVKMAAVNPIDHYVISGSRAAKPMPHIPGAEFAGTIAEKGKHVTNVQEGERVTVYSRVFDGTCDMCLQNNEMLCRNGGILSLVTNGGYAEYARIPAANAFPLPDNLSWETAASLPVAALTPYHALHMTQLQPDETIAVFGASGNTGLFAVQLAKRTGANVIAVTSKPWVKDYGADHTIPHADAPEQIKTLTDGKMANVVLNSIGKETWQPALQALGVNGRLAFFGVLTGGNVQLTLNDIYGKQQKIIGSTGGTRSEFAKLIQIAPELQTRVWKKYPLENGKEALNALFAKERQGRILIEA